VIAIRPAQAPLEILDQAADALLTVEPASLRDPTFAIASAEGVVALSAISKGRAI
jgi:hypothetical protein